MLARQYRVALAALTLLAVVRSATASIYKRASGVTSDASGIDGQTFDYIVVGAGLTGVTVAARLAENSALKVLLVEVGGDDRTNPNVYDIYKYSVAFNGPLDWAWPTDQGKTIHGSAIIGPLDSLVDSDTICLVERHLVAALLSMAVRGHEG